MGVDDMYVMYMYNVLYTLYTIVNHCVYMYMPYIQHVLLAAEKAHVQFMSIEVTIQYSNYSVVSFPHYSSSTVVLIVIGILVN